MDEKSKNLLEDVNVYRGAAGSMSDHCLVEAKVRMKSFLKKEREEVTAKRVVRVSELEKEEVREAFVILMVNEWDRFRNTSFKCTRRVGNVQKSSNGMYSCKSECVQKNRKVKKVECLVG